MFRLEGPRYCKAGNINIHISRYTNQIRNNFNSTLQFEAGARKNFQFVVAYIPYNRYSSCKDIYTHRKFNFRILLTLTEIGLYLLFFNWFNIKQNFIYYSSLSAKFFRWFSNYHYVFITADTLCTQRKLHFLIDRCPWFSASAHRSNKTHNIEIASEIQQQITVDSLFFQFILVQPVFVQS